MHFCRVERQAFGMKRRVGRRHFGQVRAHNGPADALRFDGSRNFANTKAATPLARKDRVGEASCVRGRSRGRPPSGRPQRYTSPLGGSRTSFRRIVRVAQTWDVETRHQHSHSTIRGVDKRRRSSSSKGNSCAALSLLSPGEESCLATRSFVRCGGSIIVGLTGIACGLRRTAEPVWATRDSVSST